MCAVSSITPGYSQGYRADAMHQIQIYAVDLLLQGNLRCNTIGEKRAGLHLHSKHMLNDRMTRARKRCQKNGATNTFFFFGKENCQERADMLVGCVCPKICRINYPLKYSKTSDVTICFMFKALPSSDCLKLFPELENCLLGSKYFAGQHLYSQIEGKH